METKQRILVIVGQQSSTDDAADMVARLQLDYEVQVLDISYCEVTYKELAKIALNAAKEASGVPINLVATDVVSGHAALAILREDNYYINTTTVFADRPTVLSEAEVPQFCSVEVINSSALTAGDMAECVKRHMRHWLV